MCGDVATATLSHRAVGPREHGARIRASSRTGFRYGNSAGDVKCGGRESGTFRRCRRPVTGRSVSAQSP